jgi:hypothetical protein
MSFSMSRSQVSAFTTISNPVFVIAIGTPSTSLGMSA